jgi:hypothetical protein
VVEVLDAVEHPPTIAPAPKLDAEHGAEIT